ncbi:MAG: hypothetical protein K5634_06730 [Sphaerochaetaceae bacterium]|nr:hypothetical protein [Sphaerochaetaceae bacterium]
MKKIRKNTGKTLLIAVEILFCAGVVYLCFDNINRTNYLVYASYAAHSVLILIFSLVFSSSENFVNTDLLFVKRFALFSIISDGVVVSRMNAPYYGVKVIDSLYSAIMICLIMLQLTNLLGSILFSRKSNPKSARKYKFLTTLFCLVFPVITPYCGSFETTLNQAFVMIPVLALLLSIVFGIIAQFFNPEREALPVRNLCLIAILTGEILQFFPFSVTGFVVCVLLLFISLVWVIIFERVNNRRIS